jgi:hypothetical protein
VSGEKWEWTIDVCRTCGRLATWPGCEHWHSAPNWCRPIRVRPVGKFELELGPGDGSAVPESRGKDQGEKASARRRL